MTIPLRILSLAYLEPNAGAVLNALHECGFAPDCTYVASEHEFVAAVSPVFDLILVGNTLPHGGALRALELAQACGGAVPVIVVACERDEEQVVAAMRCGAADYICTDRLARLGSSVRRALDQRAAAEAKQRAHAQVLATEQRFRAMIEQSADGYALVEAGGFIIYGGPSTYSILGYTAEELLGKHCLALLHPDDASKAHALLQALLTEPGQQVLVPLRVRHANGDWLWLEIAASNMLAVPNVAALVLNYRVVIVEGEMGVDEINALHADFVAPPAVTVSVK